MCLINLDVFLFGNSVIFKVFGFGLVVWVGVVSFMVRVVVMVNFSRWFIGIFLF